MKEFYLAELNVNQDFTDFFMLRSLDIRLGGNKKEYLDITISDSSGEMSAKKWDITEEEAEQLKKIPIGEPVKIKGIVTEWNGIKQIKIGKRTKPEILFKAIAEVCSEYVTLEEIATKTGRSTGYLKDRIIPEMLRLHIIERLFPEAPTNPHQKYRRI